MKCQAWKNASGPQECNRAAKFRLRDKQDKTIIARVCAGHMPEFKADPTLAIQPLNRTTKGRM